MMLLEVLASLCKCAQTPKRILFMANTDYSVKILFLVTYGGMPMSSGEWRVASGSGQGLGLQLNHLGDCLSILLSTTNDGGAVPQLILATLSGQLPK
jgi:hypothetical protein